LSPAFECESDRLNYFIQNSIQLHYASGSLATYLGLEYSAKLGDAESTKTLARTAPPQDIPSLFGSKLPSGYFDNHESFLNQVKVDEISFKPMGTKIGQYSLESDDKSICYEFYKVNYRVLMV
jgi:histone acetyltransferase 1